MESSRNKKKIRAHHFLTESKVCMILNKNRRMNKRFEYLQLQYILGPNFILKTQPPNYHRSCRPNHRPSHVRTLMCGQKANQSEEVSSRNELVKPFLIPGVSSCCCPSHAGRRLLLRCPQLLPFRTAHPSPPASGRASPGGR